MFKKIIRAMVVTLVTVMITLAVAGAVYALGQNTTVRSAIVGQAGALGGRERPAQLPAGLEAGAVTGAMPRAGERHDADGGDVRALASIARNLGLIALVTAAVVIPQKLFKLLVRRRPLRAASRA